MRKIESKVEECADSQRMRSFDKNNNNILVNRQNDRIKPLNECYLGTMTIKSIYNNPIKIHLRNIKTEKTIAKIQKELGETLTSCSARVNNIKWYTNKISFDPVSHLITSVQLIAIFPEPINVDELSKRVRFFFGGKLRAE